MVDEPSMELGRGGVVGLAFLPTPLGHVRGSLVTGVRTAGGMEPLPTAVAVGAGWRSVRSTTPNPSCPGGELDAPPRPHGAGGVARTPAPLTPNPGR